MRRTVVLLTLALAFLAPLATSVAEAAEAGTVQAPSRSTLCRRHRAKKQQSESKPKKKDKDGKKPYGFEL
jgi:Ni/Co efflux regulator RcnB